MWHEQGIRHKAEGRGREPVRLDAVAESLIERVIGHLNIAPVPLMHTHVAMLLARTVMEAAEAGVFEAAAAGPVTPAEVASRCRLDTHATSKLLDALATSGYFVFSSGRYALTPMARKWVLPSSPQSVHDKLLFQFLETDLVNRMGDYLRSGQAVTSGGHYGDQTPEFWRAYQRAMRAIASISAAEVARRTYVPRGAQAMLDVGGSHGLYSVVLCRRYPRLSATVLDLAEAIAYAAPLLAAEGMGDRVRHQAGDIREVDLGDARYDVILVSSLLHHFDEGTNAALVRKLARALRPGGALVVQELVRRTSPDGRDQPAALLDLYFALSSRAGTWALADIVGWQRDAGLRPRRPIRLRTMPLGAQQTGLKPR